MKRNEGVKGKLGEGVKRIAGRAVIALSLVAGAVTVAPSQAVAGVCDYTCNVQGIMARISEAEAAIKMRVAAAEMAIIEAIKAIGEQIAGTIEKQSKQQEIFAQGQMTYQGQIKAAEAAAEAEDTYLSPSSQPTNACSTIQVSTQIGSNAQDARLNAKAIAAAKTGRSMYTPSASVAHAEILKRHAERYCSAQDAQRGRCTAAPGHLQNADILAGTLLAPAAAETYSPQEMEAARQFITNATDPFPTEMLPRGYENTEKGRNYILAQMAESAQLSVAQYSMSMMLANRSAPNPNSANPQERVSLMGLARKYVEDRFVRPDWRVALSGKNEHGLLREVAEMMAFKNWLDYHAFMQMERMEAVLAVDLAISAKQHNAPILASQRAAVLASATQAK